MALVFQIDSCISRTLYPKIFSILSFRAEVILGSIIKKKGWR